MKLLLTLPVYNEEKIIENSVNRLYKYIEKNLKDYDWQIVIANNASTDRTQTVAEDLQAKLPNVSVVCMKKKGRGNALRHLWSQKKADIYAYCDIDLSTDIKYIKSIIDAVANGADMAIGSRYLYASHIERDLKRLLVSKIYIWLVNILMQTPYTDYQCGCKAVNQKIVWHLLPKIKDDSWFFDTELILTAHFSQTPYTIQEIPVDWHENHDTKVKLINDPVYFLKQLITYKKKNVLCKKGPLT